jgi:predicted outer membrane repeat protein
MGRSRCGRSRRAISILATINLVAGMLALLTQAANAAVSPCRARNVTQDTSSDSDLQAVISAANAGDTITVKFVCVGNFVIDKDLTLLGRPTSDVPRPVLRAKGGRVVLADANVVLNNLEISGGVVDGTGGGIRNMGILVLDRVVVTGNSAALGGGGIYNTNGIVHLKDAVVRGNQSPTGGGIYNHSGTLTLRGASLVIGNASTGSGGGIFNQVSRSRIILDGTSLVTGNTAYVGAGVRNESGRLILNASSSVRGNTAFEAGGGIANNEGGRITLNGTSSVRGNTSGDSGGGIFIFSSGGVVTFNDSSSVTGNTADSDDDGVGTGGGIYVGCTGALIGAVDGGNVNANYLGSAAPVENNIVFESPCI